MNFRKEDLLWRLNLLFQALISKQGAQKNYSAECNRLATYLANEASGAG